MKRCDACDMPGERKVHDRTELNLMRAIERMAAKKGWKLADWKRFEALVFKFVEARGYRQRRKS